MVTIKISGNPDIELTAREFNLMALALKLMISWDTGGMFGDGDKITDEAGLERARTIIKKIGYESKQLRHY